MDVRKLFLLDASGALISCLLIGFLQIPHAEVFGIPPPAFRILLILAISLMLFSSFCFFFLNTAQLKLFLRKLAWMNTTYLFITMCFIIQYSQQIRIAGWIYYGLEILVMSLLIFIEYRLSKTKSIPNEI
jgi:hypothetical protein